MRAMTFRSYGGPGNLTLVDIARPTPGPGQILVRVLASSVNPVDWKLMAGYLDPMIDSSFPVIPGWDVAGVVVGLGFDTPEFAIGDEVLAHARKGVVQHGTFAENRGRPWGARDRYGLGAKP